jgi:hypothetical protein
VASWVSTLFEAPLEEFIARRNELAKAAKDPEEAKRIKAFRKPSKALWLVNDVARREPAQVKALIAATARVRKAQEKGASGDELREAMREQRQALAALTAAAGDESVERRVHDTLQAAAMADPDALRDARIEEELQPSGFDAVFGLDIAPRTHAAAAKRPTTHDGAAHGRSHAGTAGSGAKSDAAAAKREAEAKKQREHELRAARKEADRLDAQAKKLETAAEHAERAAVKAEEAAAEAQRRAATARETSDKADAEAKAARAEAVEAAKRAES